MDDCDEPLARETLQRILFPDGRASVPQFQRVNRISWRAAFVTLGRLHEGGWLDGLEVSPMLATTQKEPS